MNALVNKLFILTDRSDDRMRVHELHGFLTRFLVGLKELFENAVIERVAAPRFVASGLDRSGLELFTKAQ